MIQLTSCPRCQLKISDERKRHHPVVCNECGHVCSSTAENVETKLEATYLKAIVGSSALIVMMFMQLANWGDHAFAIIPLKVGDMMGSNSVASKEKMAAIALDLKKFDLAERLYVEIARADASTLKRLGKFQMARAKYKEAAESFRQELEKDQTNLDTRYYFARCLSETGQIDEASKHYDYLLHAKPGILQITVVEYYVKALLAANRLEQAKQVIERIQRKDGTLAQFMNTELKTIVERIRTRT